MLVLLKVCKSVHKFHIICLSETQVDLNFYLMIAIWKFQDIILCVLVIRQIKTWSSLYILQELFDFKNHRYQLFNKCLRLELLVGDTFCIFIALYRSPSQSRDQFESFKENREPNLESAVQNNPFLVVVLHN